MIKSITVLTNNVVGMNVDNNFRSRIMQAYLAFMVAAVSGSFKKENGVEFFTDLKNSVKNSTMPSDVKIVDYAEKCIETLNH